MNDAVAPNPDLMRRAPSIAHCHALARRRLPRFLFDYLEGGAGREDAVERNERAFRAVELVPHVGRGVLGPATEVAAFGRTWSLPIGVSPCGYADLFWRGAELATAAAAQAVNAPFVASLSTITPIEKLVEAAPSSTWLQVLAATDPSVLQRIIARARSSGVSTIVVTMDVAMESKRDRNISNGFELPLRPSLRLALDLLRAPRWCLRMLGAPPPMPGNFLDVIEPGVSPARAAAELEERTNYVTTWDDVRWFRDVWPGTMIVKGILRPADARAAVDLGADGVLVSNHGGRQYDAAPATIDMLAGVVRVSGDEVPVLIDSGVRSGLDVLRALARGATFALSGRSFYFAAAALGPDGPRHAFSILHQELLDNLRQHGVASVARIGDALPLEPEGRRAENQAHRISRVKQTTKEEHHAS